MLRVHASGRHGMDHGVQRADQGTMRASGDHSSTQEQGEGRG